MRYWIACIFLLPLLFIGPLWAQEPLTNENVLKLVKAGIGEDTIVGMVNQQPGKYALSADDMIALKTGGVSDKLLAAMIVKSGANPAPVAPAVITNVAPAPQIVPQTTLVLHDGTPIRLRLNRTLTSADATSGDNVDFEVLEDLKVDDVMLIARGGTAIATITGAEHKKRMARGGKLDVNMDYVRLVNGDKVALRAVKEVKGGGHTGAMTGAMVATAIVVWPAAPFFLFMHGKDVTIPKGTEITAYVNGEIRLDRARFVGGAPVQTMVAASPTPAQPAAPPPSPASAAPAAIEGGVLNITFTSTPSNALETRGTETSIPDLSEQRAFHPPAFAALYLPHASPFTRFPGRFPSSAAIAFSTAIIDIFRRVSTGALAMCGASTTFSSRSSPGSTRGSFSNTSIPAPAVVA